MQPGFLALDADKLSRSIKGSLSLMPLSDLIQWIELSRHSGTLVASNENLTRRFYFQAGRLIFSWSDNEGELPCLEIQKKTGVSIERMKEAMNQSERLGISFLGMLSSEEGIELDLLTSIIATLAEHSLSKALAWKTGQFCFSDHVPQTVLSSPVTLKTSRILLESAIQFDEANPDPQVNFEHVINEIFDVIRKGTIDIPPHPH
jgi:hypothetical protein